MRSALDRHCARMCDGLGRGARASYRVVLSDSEGKDLGAELSNSNSSSSSSSSAGSGGPGEDPRSESLRRRRAQSAGARRVDGLRRRVGEHAGRVRVQPRHAHEEAAQLRDVGRPEHTRGAEQRGQRLQRLLVVPRLLALVARVRVGVARGRGGRRSVEPGQHLLHEQHAAVPFPGGHPLGVLLGAGAQEGPEQGQRPGHGGGGSRWSTPRC